MERIPIIFYSGEGGNIVSDPNEGASYDTDPSHMCSVQSPTTLNELENILIPRVANHGDNIRLKFNCRFPHRQWENFVKYKVVPINDDDTLNSLLRVAAKLQSQNALEVYVEKVHLHDAPEMIYTGPFTRLLSQAIDWTGVDRPNLSEHSIPDNNVDLMQRLPESADHVPFTERFTTIDSVPTDEFEDEDFNEILTQAEDNEDEDDLLGDDNDGGGHIPAEPGGGNMREAPSPPPFYENIHMGQDDFSITSRDLIPRGRMWSAAKGELGKGMAFKDKKQLQYAVQLYHLKNNREYEVAKSGEDLWVCRCKHGCSWSLRASRNTKKHNFFEIKQYYGTHHCLYARTNRDNRNLDSNFIAWSIMGQVAVC